MSYADPAKQREWHRKYGRTRDRAAYFRTYRAAKGEVLRAYSRERARLAYVKVPRLRVRAPRKPKAAAVAAMRAIRLEAAQAALASERAASMSLALAMPELAALIDEQRRDAVRYQIKFGPDFLDVGGAKLVA